MGGSCQACERLWAIHCDGVLTKQPVESLGPCADQWGARPLRGRSNEN